MSQEALRSIYQSLPSHQIKQSETDLFIQEIKSLKIIIRQLSSDVTAIRKLIFNYVDPYVDESIEPPQSFWFLRLLEISFLFYCILCRMSFFDTHHFTPAPATIITPGPVGVESVVHVIGANGPTGPSAPKFDNDSDDDLPLTFDQEQNLLMKMN